MRVGTDRVVVRRPDGSMEVVPESTVTPEQIVVHDAHADDPTAALQRLQDHPDRRDVRLLAAVHRDGRRLCLLRQRAHDSDDLVATGPDLAPGLLAALAATLQEDLPR